MTVEPARVGAGGQVHTRFVGPLSTDRGGFYVLEDTAGLAVAGLWSDKFEGEGPGYTTDMETFGMLAFPVHEDTPDLLLIPPELPPGTYRLCTANSSPNTCTPLEIIKG